MNERQTKIAFVSPHCLADFINGAAIATCEGLKLLAGQALFMHGLLRHATTIRIMARMSSTHLVRNATRASQRNGVCPGGASDLDGCETGFERRRSFLRFRASPPPMPTGPDVPTTDGSIQYDNNGNNDGTGQTISAGNRVTFDGTYYYQFDAAGNRTFKYKSDTVCWTPRPRTSPSTPGTTATA